MPVSLSEIKPVLTKSEYELVRSSRNPGLKSLTTAELKKSATRSRKLFKKWSDLARKQNRSSTRKHGFPDTDTRTQLKADVFRDALAAFESRIDEGQSTATAGVSAKSKRSRTAAHREERASVREELKQKKRKLATDKRAPSTATKKSASDDASEPVKAKGAVAAARAKKKLTKPLKGAKAKRPKSGPLVSKAVQDNLTLSKAQLREAKTATKSYRINKSGLNTRVLGHVSARGKRKQARRDSKNP